MQAAPARSVARLRRRVLAYLIDAPVATVIAFLAVAATALVAGPAVKPTPRPDALAPSLAYDPAHVTLETLAVIVISGLYFAGSWLAWRATPAQRLMGVRVGDAADPQRLVPTQAVARWLLLGAPWGLAGALAASSSLDTVLWVVAILWPFALLVSVLADRSSRRGLHDRLAHTVVIDQRAGGRRLGPSMAPPLGPR